VYPLSAALEFRVAGVPSPPRTALSSAALTISDKKANRANPATHGMPYCLIGYGLAEAMKDLSKP
jgi:hypothetical protein